MTARPRIVGVIPARYASTRLPGKALIHLCGRPLIQWVYERARRAARLDELRVATDDARILDAVRAFGGLAVLTRADHPSGTDRVAEAVQPLRPDVVINIQGDEPLIDPALIDRLAEALSVPEAWEMATAACPVTGPADVTNPSVVKVVTDRTGRALYFSRAPIPFAREPDDVSPHARVYWRHIGIYGYRHDFLQKLVAEPPCLLERIEKLEQLRALDLGARIKVLQTRQPSVGVDMPEDVPAAEAALIAAGLA